VTHRVSLSKRIRQKDQTYPHRNRRSHESKTKMSETRKQDWRRSLQRGVLLLAGVTLVVDSFHHDDLAKFVAQFLVGAFLLLVREFPPELK